MTMEEFGDMIRQVRLLEQALGSGDKVPTETELLKLKRLRRGIYDRNSLEPSESPDGLWLGRGIINRMHNDGLLFCEYGTLQQILF